MIVLLTGSLGVHPETYPRNTISAASIFLSSALFTAKFSELYRSTGTTITLKHLSVVSSLFLFLKSSPYFMTL